MLPTFRNKSRRSYFDALDQKLVKQMGGKKIPSFTQLKYFSRFLTRAEKIFFNICLIAVFLSLSGISAVFAIEHVDIQPKAGGEYSEALVGQPKYINPIFSSVNEVDQDISALTYAGLFRYQGLELVPDIAQSYTVSTDTKRFNIRLRQDVKFADGEPLTADDVVFTFDMIQTPDVASPLLPAFSGVKVEALGDYEVLFTLKSPFAPFLSSLTVGILPEHIWGNSSNPNGLRLSAANLQPMGAGPWRFGSMIKDSTGRIDTVTLVPNENYFGKTPLLNSIRFKFFNDSTGALEALRSQSVDAVANVPRQPNLQLNNKNINFYNLQLPEYTALFFNQSNQEILKNEDVRQALSEAIDREKIINDALGGQGVAVSSPILSGMIGYSSSSNNSPDLEAANEALDKQWKRIEPEEYFKIKSEQLIKQNNISTSTSSTILSSATSTDSASTTGMTGSDEGTAMNDVAAQIEQINDSIRQTMDKNQQFYRRDKNNKLLELTIITADTDEYSRVAEEITKIWQQIGVKTTVEKLPVNRLVRDNIKNRTYGILLYSEIVGGDPDPYAYWHSSQIDYPGLNLAGFGDKTADGLLEEGRSTFDAAARASSYTKFQTIISKEIPAIFLYTPLHTMAVNKEVNGVSDETIVSPSDRFNELNSWYTKQGLKWK